MTLKFENLALNLLEELNKCIQKVFFILFAFCNIQVKYLCVYIQVLMSKTVEVAWQSNLIGMEVPAHWKIVAKTSFLEKHFFLQRYCQNCYNVLSQTEKNSTIA